MRVLFHDATKSPVLPVIAGAAPLQISMGISHGQLNILSAYVLSTCAGGRWEVEAPHRTRVLYMYYTLHTGTCTHGLARLCARLRAGCPCV